MLTSLTSLQPMIVLVIWSAKFLSQC